MNPNRPTPRLIIKMAEVKDRKDFEGSKRTIKRSDYKGSLYRWSTGFFYRKAAGEKGEWQKNILKVIKGKICSLGYSVPLDYHFEMRKDKELLEQTKLTRI